MEDFVAGLTGEVAEGGEGGELAWVKREAKVVNPYAGGETTEGSWRRHRTVRQRDWQHWQLRRARLSAVDKRGGDFLRQRWP